MKYLKIMMLFIILNHTFAVHSENGVDGQNVFFEQWDEKKLNGLLAEKEAIKDKTFDDNLTAAKICHYLSRMDFVDNQYNYTKRNRNAGRENPGYINLSILYAENACKTGRTNSELLFLLSFNYLSLIDSPETYAIYYPVQDKYRKLNLRLFPDDYHTNLYETYFNLIYPEAGGGNKARGTRYQKILLSEYQTDPGVFDLLSEICFLRDDFDKSVEYAEKAMVLNPYCYTSKKRLELLNFIGSEPVIFRIDVKPCRIDGNIIKKFIKVKEGERLSFEKIKRIKTGLQKYKPIQEVSALIIPADGGAIIELDLSIDDDKILAIFGGYELIVNADNPESLYNYIAGIFPPTVYYSYPNISKNGMLNLSFMTSLVSNDIELNLNCLEYMDFQFGFYAWPIPFYGNDLKAFSKKRDHNAGLTSMDFIPRLGMGRIFKDAKISIMAFYKPDLIVVMPEDFPLNDISGKSDFIMPPDLIVEHNINVSFAVDRITLLESGWVRKGFYLKLAADYYKQTPDNVWGYKDNPNEPKDHSFLFHVNFEYSDFIKSFFYYSIGFQYKGGINLYKRNLIPVSKAVIGVPFGTMIGVHGLPAGYFYAEHVFLLNTLIGFKAHDKFHCGFMTDVCGFFERDAVSFNAAINGSNLYINTVFGFGTFFRISFANNLNLICEGSFSYETGGNKIYGPILGIFIQKIFINPKINKKKSSGSKSLQNGGV